MFKSEHILSDGNHILLLVSVPPTIIRDSLETSLVAVHNQTVKIFCPATGIPEPDIMWAKEEVLTIVSFLIKTGSYLSCFVML